MTVIAIGRFLLISIILSLSAYSNKDVLTPKSADFFILDRITGKTEVVTIPVGEKVKVGGLTVSVQYCYVVDRPVGKAYSAFLQVWDNTTSPPKILYSSWMRVGCKNLGAPFEHPNYTIWLKECEVE